MPGRAAKGNTKKVTREENKKQVGQKVTSTGPSTRISGLITGKDHTRLSHSHLIPQANSKPFDKRHQKALDILNSGGSPDKAYPLFKAAAESGDAVSKYAIGTWYLHGFFLKKDLRTAIKLLREAADENVAFSAFDLAVCYERGVAVRQNFAQAAKYYLRAFLFGDIQGAVGVERLLYWEKEAMKGRKLSREFGRFLGSMGK